MFAAELKGIEKNIRKLQRKMDRSRRANNPDNYNANGTAKKGKILWNESLTYQKILNRKANLERKLAATRQSLHGRLVNSILSKGDLFKLEKLSYRAFQKLSGKSVGKRAPGMFVSHLKRQAENAGAVVVEFPTYSTKLSQTCQCGRVQKKKLSERVHQCSCGITMLIDLYSAFLAKNIDPNTNSLQVSQLSNDWRSTEQRWVPKKTFLGPDRVGGAGRDATLTLPANGGLVPSSFGRCPEAEWVVAEVSCQMSKSFDVVGIPESKEEGINA